MIGYVLKSRVKVWCFYNYELSSRVSPVLSIFTEPHFKHQQLCCWPFCRLNCVLGWTVLLSGQTPLQWVGGCECALDSVGGAARRLGRPPYSHSVCVSPNTEPQQVRQRLIIYISLPKSLSQLFFFLILLSQRRFEYTSIYEGEKKEKHRRWVGDKLY